MAIAEQSKEYCKNYFENLSQRGKKMSIAKQAEEYIKRYFQDIRKIKLEVGKGEFGFDFHDESSKLFVEIKGSKKAFNDLQGWYFTNTEYEKARSCRKKKKKYEIHLVVGIGSESPEHYTELGEVLLDQAKPEIWWYLYRTERLPQV